MWCFLLWNHGILWEAVDSYRKCCPEKNWWNTFHLRFQKFTYFIKIIYKTLDEAEREEITECYLSRSMSCQTYWIGLCISGVWQYTASCETGTCPFWSKDTNFRNSLIQPLFTNSHLHFYLFLCLTQLSITQSHIFLNFHSTADTLWSWTSMTQQYREPLIIFNCVSCSGSCLKLCTFFHMYHKGISSLSIYFNELKHSGWVTGTKDLLETKRCTSTP